MHIGAMRELTFSNPSAKKTFNSLRQAFTKVPIFQHFDPEYHIWIKTNLSSYAIGGILSLLTFDQVILNSELNLTKSDFGQWYPVAYFLRKMILAETCYM